MDTHEDEPVLYTSPDESREYFDLFNAASELIFTLTGEGQIVSSNPAFERKSGWRGSEWVGKRLEALVHPADVPSLREMFKQANTDESPSTIELRIRSQSGKELLLECTAFPIRRNGREARIMMFGRDITEKKRIEEDLFQSDAKLRSVLESANDAIVFIGSDLEILSWNRAAQKIFGHSEEISGQPFETLLSEKDRHNYRDTIQQLLNGGESRLMGKTLETEGLKSNRTAFPIELSLAIWMFRGKPIFAAIIRDISKRKENELALQKKNALVQLIQEIAIASNEAMSSEDATRYALDRICDHTSWPIGHVYYPAVGGQARSTSLWHLSSEERLQRFKDTIPPGTLFSSESLPGKVFLAKHAIWLNGVSLEPDLKRREAASEAGFLSVIAVPVLTGAEVVAVLEFFSDSSEQTDPQMIAGLELVGAQLGRVFEREEALKKVTEAEARFRQLVESIHAIVWRRDAKTMNFSFVSHQAEKILGYPTKEWIENPKFWEEHIHAEDRDATIAFGNEQAEKHQNHEFDYRMIAADGRIVSMRNFVRVMIENNEPKELIGVMIDLTERKKAEDDLKQSRERLRALSAHLQFVREQERIKIAREVHDDLGQVLSALRMELSLLNQNLLESSETAPRQRILKELSTMSHLVDDTIRSVRRIITELRPEVLDHLDLSSALEWQIQEFRARTGIKTSFQSNLVESPLNQEGVTAIFRILQETLTNVYRHAQSKSVQVKLIEDQDSIILEVRDNGKGITDEDSRKSGSFGILGMKERVLLLGGTLSMEGGPGKGTTVRVAIPLSENR
jgi:PAS domain S-box-containing protein